MDSGDMSKRAHWMIRLAALALIAAAAWFPRSGVATADRAAASVRSGNASAPSTSETRARASVALR